jgi:hypothetical protein
MDFALFPEIDTKRVENRQDFRWIRLIPRRNRNGSGVSTQVFESTDEFISDRNNDQVQNFQ